MHSPASPESHDPQDDDFGPHSIKVIEPMSDALWARFVQGLAPKGPAPASREPDQLADIRIRATSGNVLKFRRAAFLMDKALLATAIEAMIAEREAAPRWDANHGAQRVWDLYCARQHEEYGCRFTPDIDTVCMPRVLNTWDLDEQLKAQGNWPAGKTGAAVSAPKVPPRIAASSE